MSICDIANMQIFALFVKEIIIAMLSKLHYINL